MIIKEYIEDGIGAHGIQCAGSEEQGHEHAQAHVDDNDGDAICDGVLYALAAIVLAALQEEAHGHGDNGPYARGEQCKQTACQTHQENPGE